MSDQPSPRARAALDTPWSLKLRRARYQIAPVVTMLISASLAGWLWVRHTSAATATGEVSAMRVSVESKVEGVLEKLPQPIHVFDTVRDGQLIARVDLSLVEKQLEALRAAAATSQPGAGGGAGAGGMSSAERDAKIAELQARLDAREVKSPIDGTVMEIRQYPGEGIKLGKTLMVIAGGQGDFITGYLREDQPIRPTPGMAVTVRTRGRGGSAGAAPRRTFQTYVASVAPQFEPMPSRHLRNPNIPEWVLPVQITIPADQDLVPGEVVDLTFHARD